MLFFVEFVIVVDVGDCIDDVVVEEVEVGCGEGIRDVDVVGVVGVEEEWLGVGFVLVFVLDE